MNSIPITNFIIRLITQFERYLNIIFRDVFIHDGWYANIPLFFYCYLTDRITIVPYNNGKHTPRAILKTTVNTTMKYRRLIE